MEFILQTQGWFTIQILIYVICLINIIKKKNDKIISEDIKKSIWQTRRFILDKKSQQYSKIKYQMASSQ